MRGLTTLGRLSALGSIHLSVLSATRRSVTDPRFRRHIHASGVLRASGDPQCDCRMLSDFPGVISHMPASGQCLVFRDFRQQGNWGCDG